ncbi:hypothetical protein LXL04_024190 [Taraxacum kok-saghyz]
MVVPATGTLAPSSILIEFWPDYRATTMEEMDLPSSVSGKAVQFLRQQHLQSRHTFESKIKAQGNSQKSTFQYFVSNSNLVTLKV